MFLEILIALLIGITAGTFTGIIPGIHINLLAVMLLSLSPILLSYTSVLPLVIFIIAMSVTHSFLDPIPSIFLGAPDSSTALGVLPGHRYLIKGYGLMAVKLTVIGSFGALILSIILYPILKPFVIFIYPLIKDYVAYILILVVLFMVLRDRLKLWSLLLFLLSGSLGIIVLTWPNLKDPLFPMLSGLFGISTLLYSIKDNSSIPEQKQDQKIKLKPKITIKALLSGQFSGFLTAVLPGIGAATAAVISLQITRKLGDNGFMILMGSIGTVNFILSILTFQTLEKARNGSIVAIQQLLGTIDTNIVLILLLCVLISGSISSILTFKLGKTFSELISKIDYKKLIITIIIFILFLTIFLSGWRGIIILLVSTALGLIPAIVKVARVHAMGCLLLPVICFFLL